MIMVPTSVPMFQLSCSGTLSQKALGKQLRGQGHRVANHALRSLLAAATDLTAQQHPLSGQPPGDP